VTDTGETVDRLEQAQRAMESMHNRRVNIDPQPSDPPNGIELERIMMEHAFTDSWARPGLDPLTKSLLTVTIAISMGSQHVLRAHTRGAITNGATRDDIVEVLIHTAAYAGIARTAPAWATVREVFAEADARSNHA
jgi:4-carboxymuconolactone decarboxylase